MVSSQEQSEVLPWPFSCVTWGTSLIFLICQSLGIMTTPQASPPRQVVRVREYNAEKGPGTRQIPDPGSGSVCVCD